MTVRNFWVKVDSDGSIRETGPRAREGRLEVILRVREQGDSVRSVSILAYQDRDNPNVLHVKVFDENNNVIHEHVTTR